MESLTRYDAMRTALVESHRIDDVKDIRDKAEALRLYAKQAGEGLENQNMMAEIKLRAERRCGELLGEMENAPTGPKPQLGNTLLHNSPPPTLADMGISRMQSSRWQAIAAVPEPIFEQHLATVKADAQELTSSGVLRVANQIKRQEVNESKVEPPPFSGHYQVLYVDPPWRYEHSKTDSRKIENHYPTMELDDICALPVTQIAEDDAVLFLWATSPKLHEAMQVIDAWGFTYRTCMVWDKERMGMGYYARQQHELLLIAAVGAPPVPEPANRPVSVIRARRDNEHSRKPTEFYEIIERMYPERTKVELFARIQRDGWATWGNEPE